VDVPRLEFFYENDGFTAEVTPYPPWRLPADYGIRLPPEEKHRDYIDKIVSKLETTGHLAHGPRTPQDPWVQGGAQTIKGSYRLERAELRRITMPGEMTHIWYGRTKERHLFLCENWKDCHEPPICSLWRGYDLAPIFSQLFFRPLIETTLDTSLLYAHQAAFRSDPVETLYHLGASASAHHDVHVLYGLRDTVFPLNDDPDRTALFGYPIAIWEDQPASEDETTDAEISNVLVFFSVDDPGTQALMSQIKQSRLLKSFELSFGWAIDQYGQKPNVTADQLTLRLRAALQQSGAQGLVVHLGAAFSGNSEAYRTSLRTISSEFPHIAIVLDQPDLESSFSEVALSSAAELRELVEFIFN